MRTAAIVPAAGRGSRFGSSDNKVWADLCGRPVLEWSVSAIAAHPAILGVVLVAAAGDRARAEALAARVPRVLTVVTGGATRAESVQAGLRALPDTTDIVLVHDGARPLVSRATISHVLEGVIEHGAAVPGLPVADTVKRVSGDGVVVENVSREGLWSVQTPQGALRELLERAYSEAFEADAPPTDEAGLLERSGVPVHVVLGDPDNVKITVPEDLERAAAALRQRGSANDGSRACRTGFGYDAHRLEEGRELWLGGVRIEHDRGLVGHSDADVVLHAVCDALLGAVAGGDIGVLFPDSDPRNRGRRSSEFVVEAAARAREAGWSVSNIDVTLVAEEPRIGPYRLAMREAIAAAVGVDTDKVSVKATTNEGMGCVGRGEGLACWAVAALVPRIEHTAVADTERSETEWT